MSGDDLLMDIEFERGFNTEDDFLSGYRQRNGDYRLGCLDEDQEMDRFDELVDLAHSLR